MSNILLNKDAMIILGGGIKKDGSLETPSVCRVNLAARLFHENIAPVIITSSKWSFTCKFKPPCSIAAAMKSMLIAQNIPADAIKVEEESYDTVGNALFVKKLFLAPNNWKNILIITSEFHYERSAFLFTKILGPEYNIEFSIAENGLHGDALNNQIVLERNLLVFTKNLFDQFQLKDGDDQSIEKWLYTNHPAYAKNPNPETLNQFIQFTANNKPAAFHEEG